MPACAGVTGFGVFYECVNIQLKKTKESESMYEALCRIDRRPEPYEFYTAETLWNDPHISGKMLAFHLDENTEPASRNKAFVDRSTAFMISRFKIDKDARVADFGCGPGLYSTRLARAGARVTGIDFSERSIRYARKTAAQQGLAIDYVLQNYLEFETDQTFDLIGMIYCDFCALSPAQRKRLLAVFHGCLADDGAVFLDVFSMAAFDARVETASFEHRLMDGFWSADDYFGFMRTFKFEQEKVVLDKYAIVEASRTWEVYNWLQYFSVESIKEAFADSGFYIEAVYADVAGKPYAEDALEIALVAKKH